MNHIQEKWVNVNLALSLYKTKYSDFQPKPGILILVVSVIQIVFLVKIVILLILS